MASLLSDDYNSLLVALVTKCGQGAQIEITEWGERSMNLNNMEMMSEGCGMTNGGERGILALTKRVFSYHHYLLVSNVVLWCSKFWG